MPTRRAVPDLSRAAARVRASANNATATKNSPQGADCDGSDQHRAPASTRDTHERRTGADRLALIAHPSGDGYGADLQLLESASALTAVHWRVVVVISEAGPLVGLLEQRGAEVRIFPFPVLRRANATPRGIARLGTSSMPTVNRIRRLIRRLDPDVVYVNTVTLPWWLLAARTARIPTVCHVHEAEDGDNTWMLRALNAPLTLAHTPSLPTAGPRSRRQPRQRPGSADGCTSSTTACPARRTTRRRLPQPTSFGSPSSADCRRARHSTWHSMR